MGVVAEMDSHQGAAPAPVLLGRLVGEGSEGCKEAAKPAAPGAPQDDGGLVVPPTSPASGGSTGSTGAPASPPSGATACAAGSVANLRRCLPSPREALREIVSGVTVALAMVPEAVAFSLSAGLQPSVGIVSAFIICILTTLLGGRPAMVSGATGSIAALIGPVVQEFGPEYLFYAVILMGLIQIVMGVVGVGNLVRLVPASVEIGFANGLALVIALSQLTSYKIPGKEGHHEVAGSKHHAPEVFKPFVDGVPWEEGGAAAFAAVITVISFIISVFLPRLTTVVPSALTGIVMGTAFEWAVVRAWCGSHTTLVGDMGSAGGHFPIPVWFSSEYHMPAVGGHLFGSVYKLAILMAVVGILESAMTLSLIDERTKTKGNVMRECVGQGVANIVCGACGGMGGCAMLGQSMINISAGARGRLSTFACSIFLLLILLVAYPVINILPVAALAGVMFNVVLQTFEWGSLRLLAVAVLPKTLRDRFLSGERGRYQKIRRIDAAIIVLVTVVTLLTDLAVAVGCGIVVACLMHIYDAATMIGASTRLEQDAEGRTVAKVYDVHGVLFFASVAAFLDLFDAEGDPEEVRIIFETSYISDFSAVEALNKLGERYAELGKRVTLQLMHPGSARIVDKAANLLVKEITLTGDGGRVLPDAPAFRHHIEGYRQSFADGATASEEAMADWATTEGGAPDGVRRRATVSERGGFSASDLPL